MPRRRHQRGRSIRWLIGVVAMLWVTASCSESSNEPTIAVATTATGGPALTVPATVTMNESRLITANGSEAVEPIFENFEGATFSNPTVIDNEWFPLTPGNRLVLDGTSVEDGEELAHRIVYVVTDFTKEIAGVKTVVVWIEDYSDDELVEVELAFYAQDDAGNIWFFGEHPEEYEDEEFIEAPTWIAGIQDARAGIMMYAKPEPGLPPYFQGWGPAVEWSDFGVVDSVGLEACVALGCYTDVLTIAESSLGEAGAVQLKSYARGVGTIRVDFRGDDLTQERLEVVEFGPLSAADMERYRATSVALEAHAYQISPEVYGATTPMQEPGPS